MVVLTLVYRSEDMGHQTDNVIFVEDSNVLFEFDTRRQHLVPKFRRPRDSNAHGVMEDPCHGFLAANIKLATAFHCGLAIRHGIDGQTVTIIALCCHPMGRGIRACFFLISWVT